MEKLTLESLDNAISEVIKSMGGKDPYNYKQTTISAGAYLSSLAAIRATLVEEKKIPEKITL